MRASSVLLLALLTSVGCKGRNAPRVAGMDEAAIAAGEVLYRENCASCHPAEGRGIGPNLFDEETIHGGTLEDIRRLTSEGFVEKGMPAWEPILGPEKVEAVSVYVFVQASKR